MIRRLLNYLSIIPIIILLGALSNIAGGIKDLADLPDASSFTNEGVHEFKPYKIVPLSEENHSLISRDRRLNPTRTVYAVAYRAIDDRSLQFYRRISSDESQAQKVLKAAEPIKRRVLCQRDLNRCQYAEAHLEDAEDYLADKRRDILRSMALALGYCLIFIIGAAAVIIKRFRRSFA